VPKAAALPSRRNHRPKLGQHFLADPRAAAEIVAALGDISERTVLEIGPGRGVLTTMLAKSAHRLIAIELDRVLAAQLRMQFAQSRNVEIIEGDALAVDFDTVFGPRPGSTHTGAELTLEPVRVVGNIPYYITSELLLRLFEYRTYLESMVLMVQSEVADRLSAKPGSRDYGLLSATAQLFTQVEKLFPLPPASFSPPPKVHSAVVRFMFQSRLEQLRVPERPFVDFLKLSFAQKRKTLWNNLKLQYGPETLRRALEQAQVKPTVRAEAMSLESSAALFRALAEAR
jgi:16S rRNA (adenine1518-N6/adenine1519-N6)-dimethyltransferase